MNKYTDTIFLPRTEFERVGNSVKTEVDTLEFWNKNSWELNKSTWPLKPWTLHDGPPFANGDIHMGHALNKILKDVICRRKNQQGFETSMVLGWDCHGLPIERKAVEKSQNRDVLEIRKLCREEAQKYIDRQGKQFKRLGVVSNHVPYVTMSGKYEANELDIFWDFYKKGHVSYGKKPVHWCIYDKTALAETEIEHEESKDTAVYVKFELLNHTYNKKAYVVIWTTTPWSIPSNVAIAVNKKINYGLYDCGEELLFVSTELSKSLFEKAGLNGVLVEQKNGEELLTLKTKHPFLERESPVVDAEYVGNESGTGFVHIAPAHGPGDYFVGKQYNLADLCAIDGSGKFNEHFPEMNGEFIAKKESQEKLLALMGSSLIFSEQVIHSTAHCWRCKNKTIYLSTPQWFISLDKNGLKERCVAACDSVNWLNSFGKVRFKNMLESRSEWCISRQRVWGVPLVMFYCECGEPYLDENSFKTTNGRIRNGESDKWFDSSVPTAYFMETAVCPKCGSENFHRKHDTLDVWFDSGSSFNSVLTFSEVQQYPANLYLEGSDQYRGWFQSSMILSVAFKDKAPYKNVLSTGWVLDNKGRPMSKSLGNVVDPMEMVALYGADVLRLWVISEDVQSDLRVSKESLKTTNELYKKIRNTYRWLLGSLSDFKKENIVPTENLRSLDSHFLACLKEFEDNSEKMLDAYEFHKFNAAYLNFCNSFLSTNVFDVYKDKLYTLKPESAERRSIQTVLYYTLMSLIRLASPILVFTMEEVWQALPNDLKEGVSVHKFRGVSCVVPGKNENFDYVLNLRNDVNKQIELLREQKLVGKSYDTEVVVKDGKEVRETEQFLSEVFGVSKVSLGWELKVSVSEKGKCERCWRKVCEGHKEICDRCSLVLA